MRVRCLLGDLTVEGVRLADGDGGFYLGTRRPDLWLLWIDESWTVEEIR